MGGMRSTSSAGGDQELQREPTLSMDMLLPDQRALTYHADLRWLGKIRGTARARYRDDRLDLSGCGEKVRQLIADAVVADGIEILVKEVQLFSPEFDEKVEALKSDEAKASEMEHAIRHEINVRVEENPAFYQSLRQRLEEIIEQRRLERLDDAQQLSLLNSLREELKGEQTQAQDIGPRRTAASPSTACCSSTARAPSPRRRPPTMSPTATWPPSSTRPSRRTPTWSTGTRRRTYSARCAARSRGGSAASGIGPEATDSLAAEIVDLAKVRTER